MGDRLVCEASVLSSTKIYGQQIVFLKGQFTKTFEGQYLEILTARALLFKFLTLFMAKIKGENGLPTPPPHCS